MIEILQGINVVLLLAALCATAFAVIILLAKRRARVGVVYLYWAQASMVSLAAGFGLEAADIFFVWPPIVSALIQTAFYAALCSLAFWVAFFHQHRFKDL